MTLFKHACFLSFLLFASALQAQNCQRSQNPQIEVRAQGWGFDVKNSRFLPDNIAKLAPQNIEKLKLKWAFVFENQNKVRSQPAISGDTVYIGSANGTVYALDRRTGCVRWTFENTWEVRTAMVLTADLAGHARVFFGDFRGTVFALDANNGQLIWQQKVDEHIGATLTGSPTLHQGVLYVPISSFEVALAAAPLYPCCTFRGAVAALDARTGKMLWKTPVMEAPTARGSNAMFITRYGPSGAPIWNSPTIDAQRGLLYVGTGENYSQPSTDSSDAVIAMDLKSGAIKWKRQLIANDAWNMACSIPLVGTNCPENPGKDLDVGASPILATTADGQDMLLVGQKSADVWGLNPDSGQVVWHKKLGKGGALGGVHWGMAYDGEKLYVPISDYMLTIPGLNPVDPHNTDPEQPSLTALNIKTGDIIWRKELSPICAKLEDCSPGLSAAVSAIPGAVFAGALDGHLRAYHSQTGELLWDMDTTPEVTGASGNTGHGGSIDASGPVIVEGEVYVNSGYGFFGEKAGNVLLVYSIDGK